MWPEPAKRQESDFARRFRLRKVKNSQTASELLILQRVIRIAGEVGFLADLHGPDAWSVDREQEITMGLQVMRARVRRTRQKVDRLRIFRIAHIDDRDAVGKAVADISEALVDHDLHAVAAAALVAVAQKFDVMRCYGGHGRHSRKIIMTLSASRP